MAGQRNNRAYDLYHLLWCAVDWLYPPVCGGCEKPGNRWCTDCRQQSPRLDHRICRHCGDILSQAETCTRCTASPPLFKTLRSWGLYSGPLRNAIHNMKYKRDVGLAESLSAHLVELFNRLDWKVDLVVPVPLAARRLQERGYNQSYLLALPFALACRLPFSNRAVQRVRETNSQVGLSAGDRQKNVKDAFKAAINIVREKSVLVIDDVATTGATQDACARALLNANASAVYGLTLARAAFVDRLPEDSLGR